MKKQSNKGYEPGYGTYFFGMLIVMFVGMLILQRITSTYQPWLVLGGSLICFGMSLFKTKHTYKTIKDLQTRTIWLGSAGLILTILLFTLFASNSSMAIWGKISTFGFGVTALVAVYSIVFESFFPNASVEPYRKR